MCLAILQQHNESRRCGVNGLHDKRAARLRRSTCYAAVRRSVPQRAASSAWSVTPETTTDDRSAQPMNQSRSPASPVHHRHDRFHCQTEPINCRQNSPRFTHFVYLVVEHIKVHVVRFRETAEIKPTHSLICHRQPRVTSCNIHGAQVSIGCHLCKGRLQKSKRVVLLVYGCAACGYFVFNENIYDLIKT